jgi:transcription elongation factor GreA
MSNTIFLTKEWLVKLQDELENLKNVQRVEIAAKLKEAISFWDLSENSEYEDARNEQAQVELRISDLEDQLKRVEIIKEAHDKSEKINMWSIVEIQNIDSNEIEVFKIVWSTESDILAELPMISNECPVWNALLWKKKGDNVKVKAKSESYEYKILSIK